jgi:hypothetical protein
MYRYMVDTYEGEVRDLHNQAMYLMETTDTVNTKIMY